MNATNPNTAVMVALTDEAKVEKIKEHLKAREVFPTLEAAIAKLQAASDATESFFGLPVAIKGHDAENGSIDESIYVGANVALAYVGAKLDSAAEAGKATKKVSGIKSVVVFPIPTVETFLNMADDKGLNWISKLVEKEAALVAFRSYREAATLAEFQNGMAASPASADDYVTEYARSGSGLDMDTFNAVWPGLRKALQTQQPALSKLIPTKNEFVKGLRSASFAAEKYGQIEEAGLFVKLGMMIINYAQNRVDPKTNAPAALDASAIQAWIDGRDELHFSVQEAPDYSILDSVDDMLAGL